MSSPKDSSKAKARKGTAQVSIADRVNSSLQRRYRAEARFQWYGRIAIFLGLSAVFLLFADITSKGYKAFVQTQVQLEINFDTLEMGLPANPRAEDMRGADFDRVLQLAIYERFPEVSGRTDRRTLRSIVSSASVYQLQDMLEANPELADTTQTLWLIADDDVDVFHKGYVDRDLPESQRRFKDNQIAWLDDLEAQGELRIVFNKSFFTNGDSRDPEQAGILGAAVGSLLTMLVTLILSVPLGVGAAIYLEEIAPKNRFTQFIELNINNLAAVPSIIFGLLGLAIFINFFGLPRSAPLVGGLVLALMTLPTIIIASRSALKSVPPSIREAALGVGASHTQTIMHHVLPLAMPGMLTGSIIGMAKALGETAPLLMIGMVAFIVDVPGAITDSSTVLPVQIYLWADSPERAFLEKTSGATLVLLAFLITMNGLAVILRRRLERRW
jgi:phosphate transport system permease protein